MNIIEYFSTIPSLHRSLILVCGISFFWLLENAFPLFNFQYKKWNHAGINLFFTFTTVLINFVLAFILIAASDWTVAHNFGLLYFISNLNIWIYAIIGLLLMDFFGAYLPHFVQHKTPFLWRFHLVHHSDTWIDTTSANRHHPGESVIRFVFTTLGVLIIGCPIWLIFLYQSLSLIATQFTHANIQLPKKIDTVLSYFIVSPDMHKVHHHYKIPFTDSNYGNIFSVWDRLFGTFLTMKNEDIVYGIDTHLKPEQHNKISNLLQIPFQNKRNYKKSEEEITN